MDDEVAETMAREAIGDRVEGVSEETYRDQVQKLVRSTAQVVQKRLRAGLGAPAGRSSK